MVDRGHVPPPDPEAPGPFRLADADVTQALLRDAGFDEARTEAVPVRVAIASIGEYLSIVGDTAGLPGLALRDLPDEELRAIEVALEGGFAPFAADGVYELPGVALATVAT